MTPRREHVRRLRRRKQLELPLAERDGRAALVAGGGLIFVAAVVTVARVLGWL